MSSALAPLFARLTHGIYVIGVAAGEARNAFTAAWVMQVSFDPPMLAVSINPRHSSYRLLLEGRCFTVNVLAREQLDLAAHFGRPASCDKLAEISWVPAFGGAPILTAALAWFECRLDGEMSAGDHVIVTGTVVAGKLEIGEADPLSYRDTGTLDGSSALYPEDFPSR